jgi:ribonuclease III
MTAAEDERAAARVAFFLELQTILALPADPTPLEARIPRLQEALTHPSRSHEVGGPDNQTLEFLGDAVLGLCASELLMQLYPDANEGALTRMRSGIVNAEALADWARDKNLMAVIAMGKGARTAKEHERTNVLGDAVEATVAAVYLALGLASARLLVANVVAPKLASLSETQDPKSKLQHLVQAEGYPPPVYRLVHTEGPEHAAVFTIECTVHGVTLATAKGVSKKIATRLAAEMALQQAPEAILTKIVGAERAAEPEPDAPSPLEPQPDKSAKGAPP